MTCWFRKLQASVRTAPSDVAVDQPVTVSAVGGVLGAVTMVNEAGTQVAGKLSPDGLHLGDHRTAGLQQALHAHRAVARPRRRHQPRQMTFETHSPENLTMPYLLPERRRGRRRRPAGRGAVRREHPQPVRRRAGDQGHHRPAGRGRVLLAEQPRSALAPGRITGSRAPRSTSRSTPTASISATACSARTTSPRTSPSATR